MKRALQETFVQTEIHFHTISIILPLPTKWPLNPKCNNSGHGNLIFNLNYYFTRLNDWKK